MCLCSCHKVWIPCSNKKGHSDYAYFRQRGHHQCDWYTMVTVRRFQVHDFS